MGDNGACRVAQLDAGTREGCVSPQTLSYLRDHVAIAVNTGYAKGYGFFRVDLGICTWMYHVPPEVLFVFTDRANLSDGRKGTWVEDALPSGVRFTRDQVEARGYNLAWIRAQFRFLFGLRYIIDWDRKGNKKRRWFVLLDDDTFVGLDALVQRLREYDAKGAPKHGRYLNERGWGGAGHIFDRAASEVLLRKMHDSCIERYMVRSFHASDVTLRKCVPSMGIKAINDDSLSHCHAAFLRDRMLTGRHVSMHLKREMVKPDLLAVWRVRLYYQVVYHRNVTAYRLLMRVGNCAYGGCKNSACQEGHDRAAVALFLEASQNATVVPGL